MKAPQEITLEEIPLRDWFAGQVLVGLIDATVRTDVSSSVLIKAVAKVAYDIADAMIRRRDQ